MKYNMLVVTDHTTHSATNSLYELSEVLKNDKRCKNIWVASRGFEKNQAFFDAERNAAIYSTPVRKGFEYDPDGTYFKHHSIQIEKGDIDCILVRMPQPLDRHFLLSLEQIVAPHRIINNPAGTIETSSKEFLLQVPHLCPEIKMCYSADEAVEMSHSFEIVLKPLYMYKGLGIARLSPQHFWSGLDRYEAEKIHTLIPPENFPMLAMRYLPNVSFGDKRTIVVNNHILGSALRMPSPGSWICNVAQGGQAILSQADLEEHAIEKELTPLLYKKGIVMYGFDTLVNDDGLRVLSEINTLSIGGIGPMQELSGRPILHATATLLWDYIEGRSRD